MRVIHSENKIFTLSFTPGEEVVGGIAKFCQEEGIRAGHISGLGAVSSATLGYYDLGKKEYRKKTFTEHAEILSLAGNIGVKENGELAVHIHGVFGREDFSAFGGHIFAIVISGAGEIHLRALSGEINRAHDEKTGLPLMCPAD